MIKGGKKDIRPYIEGNILRIHSYKDMLGQISHISCHLFVIITEIILITLYCETYS